MRDSKNQKLFLEKKMCHEIDSFDDNLIYHTEAYFPSNFFDNEICVFVVGTLPDFKMLRNGQVYKKITSTCTPPRFSTFYLT